MLKVASKFCGDGRKNEYLQCLESSNNQDTKSKTEMTIEENESVKRAPDQSEAEKPNLKRRKESLHKGLLDCDRSLKNLKICRDAKDEENEN